MAITDAKIQLGLPVGSTNIKKSDGTAPTVRYVPVGENLLSNGGFESNTTGWSAANGATLTRDTVTFKVGAASLKVARGTANTGATLASRVTVYPGTQYALSLWLHAATSSGASALIRWYDSGGSSISTSATSPASSTLNGWAFVMGVATAPPNAATADVELSVATANHCFFDAITLQPCVPLVESPYTEPSATGSYASGHVTYGVSGPPAFLGDVRVFDMGAQTDATLTASSYTPVYERRHVFVGDTLIDNGVARVWFKRGHANNSAVRWTVYVDGAWSGVKTLYIDTGGSATAHTIQSVRLNSVSRASVTLSMTSTDGNTATWTFRRGSYAIQVKTVRTAATNARQDLTYGNGPRWVVYNDSTTLRDDDVSTSDDTVAGASLTSPGVVQLDESLSYLSGLVMTKKPSTLYGWDGNLGGIGWRDTAATTAAFERTFWLMLMPWPWLTNGAFFKEAESATLAGGAASAADATASGGNVAALDANGETADYTQVATRDLPMGHYTLVVRAKDTTQVASDLTMSVVNTTDSTTLVSGAKTLTASYAFYTADFEIPTASDGDDIRFRVAKSTATANTISVDYFLVIPRKRNSATPTHVFFPYDVARNALMDTTPREGVRRA